MDFLATILRAQVKKEKTDKWYFIKIKNTPDKDTIKMKRQSTG